MPENQLWINAQEAAKMGVSNGDRVQVTFQAIDDEVTLPQFELESKA